MTKFVAYVDHLRSFTQRHCTSLNEINTVEQKLIGPPHRVEIRHKLASQDKDFYKILAAFKTLY